MKGRKVRSCFKPPAPTYERVSDDLVVDRLGYEPLKVIVERFMRLGGIPNSPIGADLEISSETTSEDVENAFDAPDPVTMFDKVEQYDVLATAQRLVEQLQKASNTAKTPHKEAQEEEPITDPTSEKKLQEEPKMA